MQSIALKKTKKNITIRRHRERGKGDRRWAGGMRSSPILEWRSAYFDDDVISVVAFLVLFTVPLF